MNQAMPIQFAGLGATVAVVPESVDVPTIEFGLIPRRADEPAFLARSGERSVIVRGKLRTPRAPYAAHAQVERNGDELLIRVVGEDHHRAAKEEVSEVGYEAVVRNLEPGSYYVRVVHAWRDVEWSREVPFETEVEVR